MSKAFAAALPATGRAADYLVAEAAAGRSDFFAAVDALAAAVLAASFAGKAPVHVDIDAARPVTLRHLPGAAAATLERTLDLAAQQARGAWWLPESVVLKPGVVNLPAYYRSTPQWAMNTAATLSGRVPLVDCPAALACWALLGPLADALFAPLILRGSESGTLDPGARAAAWAGVDDVYRDLRVDNDAVRAAVEAMRPGTGWSRLRRDAQLSAKVAFVDALGAAVSVETCSRFRARQLRTLAARYYTKAKKGRPTAAAVLTKALHPVIAAYFAGSWLDVLDYLGEEPAPGEQITTALPEPRLYVEASAKVEQVAAERNLPVDEVARMLASYLGSDEIRSPVERRVAVLRELWHVIDAAHACQQPGMAPLLGLVREEYLPSGPDMPFAPPAAERLLPPALLTDVEALWGGECVPRYPDRIVSARYPHAGPASAAGLAFTFWNDVALTCWFNCEGPYARTDLKEMGEYYSRDTTLLAEFGAPVDPQLFVDLKAAERRLGRPQEMVTNRTVHEIVPGFTFEASMIAGSRRDGFEILRDIVTGYRRAWAEQHLDTLLRGNWESQLRELAREVNRAVAGRGKLPTAKQFAKLGAPVANDWFGGDLSALYVALGERPPVGQRRVRLMPHDRAGLCNSVFTALGGRYVPRPSGEDDGYGQSWEIKRLASEALRYVQLEELLDRAPTAREFHAEHYNWPTGVDYDRYATVVTEVRSSMPHERPPGGTPVRTATPSLARPAEPASGVAAASPAAAPAAPPPPVPPRVAPAKPRPDDAARERRGRLRRLFGRRSS